MNPAWGDVHSTVQRSISIVESAGQSGSSGADIVTALTALGQLTTPAHISEINSVKK